MDENAQYNFKLKLSESFNDKGIYEDIKDFSRLYLEIEDIDNDSDVWNRIEDAILNTILEAKENEEL